MNVKLRTTASTKELADLQLNESDRDTFCKGRDKGSREERGGRDINKKLEMSEYH